MPTIDLGSVVGPQGEQGNTGPQGEQGVAGPSLISSSTQTTLTGVLAGDGSTVGVRMVDGTPTANSNNLVSSGGVYTKITTDVANAYQRTCNSNLLDNWFFVGGGTGYGIFPVNQRGQTSYTGSGRKFDRWGFGSTGGSMTLLESGVQITVTSGAQSFSQNIDLDPVALLGHTATVSLLTSSGTLYSKSGTLPSTKPTSTDTYISLAIPSVGNLVVGYAGGVQRFSCGVSNSSASSTSITIAAMKLELGNMQTLCHQENGVWVLNEIPNYTEEYQKCLRYFWNARFPSTGAGQYLAQISNFSSSAGTSASCNVTCPVAMHSAPTVSGTLQYIRGTEMGSGVNLGSGFTLGQTANLQGNTANFTVTHTSHSFPGLSTGLYGLFYELTLSAEI